MKEKRRSQRINYLGTGWLHHKGTQYFCRLENISLHGAMVGLKQVPSGPLDPGERCCLRLYQDAEGQRYRDLMAQIVRFESSVAGLEFIEVEDGAKNALETIIEKEQRLCDGAHRLIDLAREVAETRGIELTAVHFDKGELMPEREIHTLRFFAGGHAANVHLHRADIEGVCVYGGTEPARREIHKAIGRLHG